MFLYDLLDCWVLLVAENGASYGCSKLGHNPNALILQTNFYCCWKVLGKRKRIRQMVFQFSISLLPGCFDDDYWWHGLRNCNCWCRLCWQRLISLWWCRFKNCKRIQSATVNNYYCILVKTVEHLVGKEFTCCGAACHFRLLFHSIHWLWAGTTLLRYNNESTLLNAGWNMHEL